MGGRVVSEQAGEREDERASERTSELSEWVFGRASEREWESQESECCSMHASPV